MNQDVVRTGMASDFLGAVSCDALRARAPVLNDPTRIDVIYAVVEVFD
jgi:hypothetical protein